MFKRFVAAALTLALLLTSFAFSTPQAFAQRETTAAPGLWSSAILIQNTGSGDADVTVDFYNAAGTMVKTYNPGVITAGRSVTIIVRVQVADLPAGQYSAVVSSSQPVVASVQTSSLDPQTEPDRSRGPWTAFAYEGVSTANTATKLYFPSNLKNYFGFFSEMVIQNAGDADTTLSVEFYDQNGNRIGNAISLGTLARNTARTYAMNDNNLFSSLPSGNTSGIFGAVVTSSAAPIAGIANQWRTTPTNMTASYNAFTGGSNVLYAPSLTRKYFSFISALTIQNVDTIDAQVEVTFSNGHKESFTLRPNAARALLTENNANLPEGNTAGTFSARVTSTGGKIVGQVASSRPSNLAGGQTLGDYASYNSPTTGSAEVNIPNVLSNYFGLFTNVSVQNTGDQTTNITLNYEGGQSWTIENVPANGIANFIHLNPNPARGINNPLPTRSSVSAVARSSNGQPLVAVIQHNTERSVAGFQPARAIGDWYHVFTATPR